MDFAFFESISRAEAKEFLDEFLTTERANIAILISRVEQARIVVDFSINSVPAVLRWASKQIQTVPQRLDESVPPWIRETEDFKQNAFDFDEPSKGLVLRSAYYLGESFVRTVPSLRWDIGDPETAEQNMPVVTTFKYDNEMAPILIVENMFRRAIAHSSLDHIDRAVQSWYADIR